MKREVCIVIFALLCIFLFDGSTFYGSYSYVDGTDAVPIPFSIHYVLGNKTLYSIQSSKPKAASPEVYFFDNGFIEVSSGHDVTVNMNGTSLAIPARSQKDKLPLNTVLINMGVARGFQEVNEPCNTTTLMQYYQKKMSYHRLASILNTSLTQSGNLTLYADQKMQRFVLFCNQAILYGAVIDDAGEPLGGVGINVTWEDALGNKYNVSSVSYTREKANALGDETLAGMYVIPLENQIDYRIPPNFTGTMNLNYGELQFPEVRFSIGVFSVNATPRKTNNDPGVAEEMTALNGGENSSGQPTWVRVLGVLVLLCLIVMIWFVFLRKKVVYLRDIKKSGGSDLIELPVSRMPVRIEKIMMRDVVSVTPTTPLEQCTGLFLNNNIGCLLVVDKKMVTGILTERDIIKKMIHESHSGMLVKHCMTSPVISVEPGEEILTAIKKSLHHSIRKLPVIRFNALFGIVTHTDILRYLSEHVDDRSLREIKVNTYMHGRYVLVNSETKLQDPVERMLEKKATAILAINQQMELSGICTEKDILQLLAVNPLFIKTTPIAAVMKPHVITCSAEMSIHEANKLMLRNNIRRLPVTVGSTLIGIIDQENILQVYKDHLS
jgi:CBS domain-containing protein